MKPKPTRLDSKPCQRDHRYFAELRSARLENKSRAEPTVQAKTLRRETRKAIMLPVQATATLAIWPKASVSFEKTWILHESRLGLAVEGSGRKKRRMCGNCGSGGVEYVELGHYLS